MPNDDLRRFLPPVNIVPAPIERPLIEEVPAEVAPPLWGGEEQEQEQPRQPKNDLSDLFEGPDPEDNDIFSDDLFELDAEDDDLSDLFEVSREDIMGTPPKRKVMFKRTSRPYRPAPPTSMGGLRG